MTDGYWLFARGDCAGVRSRSAVAQQLDWAADRRPYLALLEAYCLELDGNVRAARERYTMLAAGSAPEAVELEAALRLRDLARLERSGMTRAQRKERVYAQKDESRRYNHGVRPIDRGPPSYPIAVREAAIEGWVAVDFAIEPDGSVADAVVLESNPPFVFDRAATSAIDDWRYEPSQTDEPMRGVIVLRFEIDPAPGSNPPARSASAEREPSPPIDR